MTPRARHLRLVALAAPLVIALLGCTAQPGRAPHRPPGTVELDTAAIDMITDSGAFPDRKYLVETADERAAEECMRSAGFTWTGFVYQPPTGSDEERALDLDDRRRRGYGVADPGPEPQPQTDDADDKGLAAALFGPSHKLAGLYAPGFGEAKYPVEGCLARAHAAIFGNVTTWAQLMFLPQGANAILTRTVDSDPRLAAAVQAWSRCMAAQGRHYAMPGAIPADLRASYLHDPDPVATRRAKEIQLALLDAACNRTAGLARTELDLRRSAARALPADQRSELAHLAVSFEEALARAHTTVK